jgi:hypothetical protein
MSHGPAFAEHAGPVTKTDKIAANAVTDAVLENFMRCPLAMEGLGEPIVAAIMDRPRVLG